MKREDILKLLPENYKTLCWECGAMTRHRGIQNEEELLMLVLYYSYGNSLMDVKNYAKIEFGTDISDVGFMKRFGRCSEWIKALTTKMLGNKVIEYVIPEKLKDYKVIAVDASDVNRKGAVHQNFHLHYAVNLFTLSSESFKITTQAQGETLTNFSFEKNTLVIADRIYASVKGIEHCIENQTEFILRIRNKAFNLYDKDGKKIMLSTLLKDVNKESRDFIVYYKSEGVLKPLRFCAVKKSKEEIEIENKRMKQKEIRKQISISEDTKFTHKYFFVVTSLGKEFTSDEIIELYKLRWQVEMVFKRYKSILELGSIPTKTQISSETWLNCKMLLALLIETLMSKVDFPPTGSQSESVEGDENDIPMDFNVFFYS